MKLGFELTLRTFGYLRLKFIIVYIVVDVVVDRTGHPVTSTIWSISTYAVSVWRNEPNSLVAGSPVLSTTSYFAYISELNLDLKKFTTIVLINFQKNLVIFYAHVDIFFCESITKTKNQ